MGYLENHWSNHIVPIQIDSAKPPIFWTKPYPVSGPEPCGRCRNPHVQFPYCRPFLKYGYPSHHPFTIGFSIMTQPFSGTPIYGNLQMVAVGTRRPVRKCLACVHPKVLTNYGWSKIGMDKCGEMWWKWWIHKIGKYMEIIGDDQKFYGCKLWIQNSNASAVETWRNQLWLTAMRQILSGW